METRQLLESVNAATGFIRGAAGRLSGLPESREEC